MKRLACLALLVFVCPAHAAIKVGNGGDVLSALLGRLEQALLASLIAAHRWCRSTRNH